MKPIILKEERSGWPAQARPDRKMPEPWSLDLLTGVPLIIHHALSPDGRLVAFVWQRDGDNDLYVLSVGGGAVDVSADQAVSSTPVDPHRTTPPGSSWPRRLTFDRPAQTFWSDDAPHWSPDSRSLVYAAQKDVWAADVETGRARRLTDFKHGDSNPIFSPDGRRIYFLSGRGTFENLCAVSLEGSWPIALTHFQADVSDPQPSPDGSLIAFVYQPQEDLNRSQICIVPAAGGEVLHLTGSAKVWDDHPRWSPDGQAIAFTSNRSGWRELYLLTLPPIPGGTAQSADETPADLRQLTQEQADTQSLAWHPDGLALALVVNRQGTSDLCLLDVASGQLTVLREGCGWHSRPQWSPDGRWLTVEFESPVAPPDIYQVDAMTGAARPLTASMPPALAGAGLVQPEFVTYPSTRGATIPALLFRPPTATVEHPCPAIVYPHGGPTDEYARTWDVLVQWLVAKGYAVLTPNFRGSTGYGVAHQHALHGAWGIVDTDDMLAAADFLAGLSWVDGDRLGLYGASYGSYLAVLALARDPQHRFACGVAKFGDCDILASWAQGDRIGREDLERQMGHPTTNRAGYRAGSPIYEVAAIQAPLLILHGADDARVHPKQSEQLVEALKREGKTFELFIYEDEGHGFLQSGNLQHFYAALERFLDWYLL